MTLRRLRLVTGLVLMAFAQAYKRIEAALRKIGVGFADGRQTVLMNAAPAA